MIGGMASLEISKSGYHHLDEAWRREEEGGGQWEGNRDGGREKGGSGREEGGRAVGGRVVGRRGNGGGGREEGEHTPLTGRFLQYGLSSTGGTAVLIISHEWNIPTVW